MPKYTAETIERKKHHLDAIRAKYLTGDNLNQSVNALAGKLADEIIKQSPKKWVTLGEGDICR